MSDGNYPLKQRQNADHFGSSGPYRVSPPNITASDIDDVKYIYGEEGDNPFKVFSGKLKLPVTIEVNGKIWRHEAGALVRINDTIDPAKRLAILTSFPPLVKVGGRRIKKNKTKRYRRRNSKTRKYRV